MGAAKKSEKFPIQILSLDAIKVDHALQSRVATSMEYQREFSESMLRGDVFPAVTVFWDGKVYWLADGFHRLGAAKQAAKVDPKLRGIRAEIHEGTRQDAMVFSAGANIEFSIPRTREDIKKAVWMLLGIDEWFKRSDPLIAKHCGVSETTVKRYRAGYCVESGTSLPATSMDKNGREYARRNLNIKDISKRKIMKYSKGSYVAWLHGKRQYLGFNKEQAEKKFQELVDKERSSQSLDPVKMRAFYERKSLVAEHYGNIINTGKPEVLCLIMNTACVLADFARGDTVPWAVGCVFLLRELLREDHPDIRMVVVCYVNQFSTHRKNAVFDLARQLGVEFLTPDELVASLKGPSAPPAGPCLPPP